MPPLTPEGRRKKIEQLLVLCDEYAKLCRRVAEGVGDGAIPIAAAGYVESLTSAVRELLAELQTREQEHQEEVTRLSVNNHDGVNCESASEIGNQLRYYKCSRIEVAGATCDVDSEYSSTSAWCESCRDRIGPYVEEIKNLKVAHAEELRKAREEADAKLSECQRALAWMLDSTEPRDGWTTGDGTTLMKVVALTNSLPVYRPTSQPPEA